MTADVDLHFCMWCNPAQVGDYHDQCKGEVKVVDTLGPAMVPCTCASFGHDVPVALVLGRPGLRPGPPATDLPLQRRAWC